MVEYLIKDSQTKVIAMYMEGIDHPKRLMEIAKRGDQRKTYSRLQGRTLLHK